MAFKDLREFIACLEAHEELGRVKRKVDLKYELGAVAYRNAWNNGPALLFERPGDSTIPIAVDILNGWGRYALAMQVGREDIHKEWIRRTATPISPRIVSSGPCKENILKGAAIDLTKLPVPIWNELDGGPVMSFSVVISKDPETDIRNAGIYRMEVHGTDRLGLLTPNRTHFAQHRRKVGKGKAFPLAIAIGTAPTIPMSAVVGFPLGVDELAMAGGLGELPIDLVPCETVPLEVPATSEIVIEGEMYEGDVEDEGPFGEFTGYYREGRTKKPVVRVTAITHRDNPIFVGVYQGRLAAEVTCLTSVSIEAELMRLLENLGLQRIVITPGGRGFICIASVRKRVEGEGVQMGMAILGTRPGHRVKIVIVVDEDIDPSNWLDVEWALATRVQPNRDVVIIPSAAGVHLDPSLSEEDQPVGRTSKMIVDATKFNAAKFPLPCVPKPEILAEVDRNWESYGISNRKG